MSNTNAPWPWSELGLSGKPDDAKDVRRAYAKRLKAIDAETDVEAFERLRSAFEQAKWITGQGQARKRVAPNEGIVLERPAGLKEMQFSSLQVDENSEEQMLSACLSQDTSKRVLLEAHNLKFETESDIEKWRLLFNDPELSHPETSYKIQSVILSKLEETSLSSLSSPRQHELVNALENRFEWVSDGVGFLKKFPSSVAVHREISNIWAAENFANKNQKIQSTAPNEEKDNVPVFFYIIALLIFAKVIRNLL